MKLQSLRLLLGSSHACGYLPQRSARSAFVDPAFPLNGTLYGALLDQGFRRSGNYAYRPMCLLCRACRSVRIVAAELRPNRAQRRCLRANADLRVLRVPRLTEEHYHLYRRYLRTRHAEGGMDPDDMEAFREFLGCGWGRTEFWELRRERELMGVCVVDRVPQGFSAVYTFYTPDHPGRSLGTYAILVQAEQARLQGLPYVYLGYWVEDSPKMDYKKHFRPLEILGPSGWERMERVAPRERFADNAASE